MKFCQLVAPTRVRITRRLVHPSTRPESSRSSPHPSFFVFAVLEITSFFLCCDAPSRHRRTYSFFLDYKNNSNAISLDSRIFSCGTPFNCHAQQYDCSWFCQGNQVWDGRSCRHVARCGRFGGCCAGEKDFGILEFLVFSICKFCSTIIYGNLELYL